MTKPTDREALAILASFAHEVAMGAYDEMGVNSKHALRPAAKKALECVGLISLGDVVLLSEQAFAKEAEAHADEARNFPANTCGASRHVQLIAEAILSGNPYPMLQEDPAHCAESMLATVAALWEVRTELARLNAR